MSVDRVEAEEIAWATLRQMRSEADMPDEDGLFIQRTQDTDAGWVFYYNSRIYCETGNPDSLVCGGHPFLVHREDGAVEFLLPAVQEAPAFNRYQSLSQAGVS